MVASHAIRVGVLMRKTRFQALESSGLLTSHESDQGCSFIHIDPSEPFQDGRQFDVLLHKISDFLDGNGDHAKVEAELERLAAASPGVVIVDSLEIVSQMFDRVNMAEGVAAIQCTTASGYIISAPSFVEVLPSELAGEAQAKACATGMQLPCILKDRSACGVEAAHHMSLLLSWDGLQQPSNGRRRILQSFVNHGGILHKVYVIGDQVHTEHKDSIADIPDLDSLDLPPVLDFDSLSMGQSLEKLRSLGGSAPASRGCSMAPPLREEVVTAAVIALRKRWPLTLFGFDIVIDHSGTHYIIDVNYFPSFKGFPNAAQHLQTALQSKLAR